MDSPSCLDLSVLDSTSKLLSNLDLVERNSHSENMDSMETNLVLEVPDTPERLSVMQRKEGACEEAARKTYYHRRTDTSHHGEGTRPDAIDNESLFRRARLANLISRSLDAELSPQTRRTRRVSEQDSFLSHRPSGSYNEGGTVKRGKVIDMGEKFHLGISYPTRCRNDRRNMGRDLSWVSEIGFNNDLMGAGSSPTGLVRGTHSGIGNSLELSDGARAAEELGVVAGAHVGLKYNGKGIDLSSDSQPKNKKAPSRLLQFHASSRNAERRRLVRNGCISPCNIAKGQSPVDGETSSSLYTGTNVDDKGKGIHLPSESQNKSEQTLLRPCQLNIPRRNTGQRLLVRNGCISPLNIARSNNVANSKRDGIGKPACHELSDGISSSQLHIVSPDSEFRQMDKMKEKEFLNETVQANDQDTKCRFLSSRELLVSGKESTVIRDAIGDVVRPAEEMGWRTILNPAGKVSLLSSHETTSISNRKDDFGHSSDQCHESVMEDKDYVNVVHLSPEIDYFEATVSSSFPHESNRSQFRASSDIIFEPYPENRRRSGAHRLTKGKRKSSSGRAHLGECSGSAFDVSEVSFPQSSGEPSNTKSTITRNVPRHGITLGPIIDVDDLPSPELRCSNPHTNSCIVSEDSSAMAQQVESDEMLARQLQEQFFNESPRFGGAEEIDANIAWTLQHELDAQRASLIGSRGRSQSRSPSIAHFYRHYPRQASQNYSVRSTSRARTTTSVRMSQSWRNNRHEMDLESRLNFLEALEAAFDNSNNPVFSSSILQAQRDFNENDYEMLLALDDNNHRHVSASLHQINSLPQSVIQTDNLEEACAICLETPSIGDTIRHLPCLHKFHKDCIDTWLRRKTSCPICKSDIT